jgi:predicted nucleotidyltransferase
MLRAVGANVSPFSLGTAQPGAGSPGVLPLGAVQLGTAEHNALAEFSRWLRQRFGARVSELSLFGSRARGESHEGSDVDVLVTIVQLTSSERWEIGQQSGDALTRWDVLLSPFAVSTDHMAELRARERRIAREIDRDAIPL